MLFFHLKMSFKFIFLTMCASVTAGLAGLVQEKVFGKLWLPAQHHASLYFAHQHQHFLAGYKKLVHQSLLLFVMAERQGDQRRLCPRKNSGRKSSQLRDWAGDFQQKDVRQATKVIQSNTRQAGRSVSMAVVAFSPLQVNQS